MIVHRIDLADLLIKMQISELKMLLQSPFFPRMLRNPWTIIILDSCHFFLTSDQPEAENLGPKLHPGSGFFDHDFL